MFKSTLCYYSDSYILVKGNIKVNNTGTASAPTNRNKKVIFKDLVNPFIDCISQINNTLVDNAKYIDIIINVNA